MDRCPYCRSEIEAPVETILCSDCGSPYHFECWKTNEGCSVFGCAGQIESADTQLTRVFSAPLLSTVHHIKNLLELNGIRCSITNQYLNTAIGDLPAFECWPQLWVLEQDAAKATELVQELTADRPSTESEWICQNCNEKLEGQFTECWNCGTERNPDA